MKGIKLKISLILLMLLPVPFSCKDDNKCYDLDVEPYYRIHDIVFRHVDKYWINPKTGLLKFEKASQDYENAVYSCDSMALYFYASDLSFHSFNIPKTGFSFTQEAFAECKRSGWAGTLDLVDKIYISSNYDFDETHNATDNLSDIVDIFTYTNNDNAPTEWMSLHEYNNYSNYNPPYQAPKRFYLLIKRKPTRSKEHQFVIRFYMKTEPDEPTKYFIITTPKFNVR